VNQPPESQLKKTEPDSSFNAASKQHVTDPIRQDWAKQNTRQGVLHGLPFIGGQLKASGHIPVAPDILGQSFEYGLVSRCTAVKPG